MEYKKKQHEKAPPPPPARRREGWYSVSAAKRLCRERSREKGAPEKKDDSDAIEAKAKVREVSEYVSKLLAGQFGTFVRGSYLLRDGPSSPPKWRQPSHWRPGPYSNALITSHDGPLLDHNRIANHRLFGWPPPPQKVNRLLRMAVDAFCASPKKRDDDDKVRGSSRLCTGTTTTKEDDKKKTWSRALAAMKKYVFRFQVDTTRRHLLALEAIKDEEERQARGKHHKEENLLVEEEAEWAPPAPLLQPDLRPGDHGFPSPEEEEEERRTFAARARPALPEAIPPPPPPGAYVPSLFSPHGGGQEVEQEGEPPEDFALSSDDDNYFTTW